MYLCLKLGTGKTVLLDNLVETDNYAVKHNYGPPALNGITFCSQYTVYLYENFRHYSRGNAESANLNIICLLIKCSLLAAV